MMKMILMYSMMIMLISSLLNLTINCISAYNKNLHPMIFGSMLLMMSIFTSMNMNTFNDSTMFSFIMFLIVIGGMMILFLYFMSFISNMKMMMKFMYLKMIPIKFLLVIMFIIFMLLNKNNFLNWFYSFNEINTMMNLNNNDLFKNNINCMYMYMYLKMIPTIIMMIYLFLCLTLIVKMFINKKMSMRMMN
uniref:NADH dehydrogenase subunit 6 n=1 Tax=Trichogramma japonicum TaxID=311206 RepID=A0A384SNA2_9HYME|nr:NADH dehydrogenase subunit 6 [Trichogramma japonicum]AOM68230.1 NADH dehydrogenase subunit 6 [Trichogramma japonicum]